MRFKNKITGAIVTIKTGTADLCWYTKENDPKKTLPLLPADKFFAEHESLSTSKEKEKK